MIQRTRLSDGTRLVTESMPDAHSVTIGFWVDAGSRDEPASIAGASHFLEHLLFKGTDSRSARDIAEAVEAVGGEMNAFTTKEYTTFYTRLLDEDLDLGLDILCDIMTAPAFRPDEIDAERQVILEEILMHEDEPADLVHDVFAGALYPEHPLGREVIGTSESITAMRRDDIVEYFRTYYGPENIVVAVAGHVEHDQVRDGLERRLDGSGGPGPARPAPALLAPRHLAVCSRHTEQAHLVVGMPALSRSDEGRYALAVVSQILGGGMSSRLFQEIREKRGLAYAVYSHRSGYRETGALAIYAGTAPSHVDEVLDLIDAELNKLVEGSITERELDIAKGHIRGSLALSLEDSAGRMTRIGRSELVHGEVLTYEELAARTDAITLDEAREAAERVLRGDRVLAVVGPFDEDVFARRVA